MELSPTHTWASVGACATTTPPTEVDGQMLESHQLRAEGDADLRENETAEEGMVIDADLLWSSHRRFHRSGEDLAARGLGARAAHGLSKCAAPHPHC